MRWITFILAVAATVSCGASPEVDRILAADALRGEWRSVLISPGGELPFGLAITFSEGRLQAVIRNGQEEVPTSAVVVDGDRVSIEMDWYDSKLDGRISGDGLNIEGTWRKIVPGGVSELPWMAEKSVLRRFQAIESSGIQTTGLAAVTDVAGAWRITFTDDSGDEDARGEFEQDGERVSGTILTSTGDYRYLEGSYEKGVLRLSTFDGAHAFLFHAVELADGTLDGDFWSRDSSHTKWTAERAGAEDPVLPDPWNEVKVTSDDRRFRFSFADRSGSVLASDEPVFENKVVLVNLFGSWCPNCNDEAPILAGWHRRWSAEGLEIVGLAFEFSGDPERDRRVLDRFRQRYDIEYPLLLAGISDKAEAALAVPDISAVLSYPTTIFIGRDGRVRWIHSGFAGPGTGNHHEELVAEMEEKIVTLLEEPG